ncbi:diguanylate cyclase [Vibrio sp. 99-70-13A1]|uniref:sensor domain-containing diguanylate cyclase n=1 Tax=Vibrio sp. 99-70-13A1 TaxID=2607601 RepID=UPI00149360D6|nr:diguanylate cyclase [Vibrio sp. 99-70-13A1]NOH97198.1 diguanylate cyclase [Vibrio sp. 99-70-13A1]
MLYLAASQLKEAENSAHTQSSSNIRIAADLVRSNIEATFAKLYLLEKSLLPSLHTENEQHDFDILAKNILKRSSYFSDIIHFKPRTQVYSSSKNQPLTNNVIESIQWRPIQSLTGDFFVSSVYQKPNQRWVFSVKRSNLPLDEEVWIEFDLLHTTQGLRDLKTLNKGYVFVVDKSTEKLLFHPDPARIGSQSISYNAGIKSLLDSGLTSGKYEYYYQGNFKVSVFDAENDLNWVFIAGTDRREILSSSYQFTIAGILIASMLLLWLVFNYLTHQLNSSLMVLNQVNDLASFKHQLKSIFDKFTHHCGVQFCLYDQKSQNFSTLDYHGNKTIIHSDGSLAASFQPNTLTYQGRQYTDSLAKKLRIHQRHYCIPLYSKEQLIAVIYVSSYFPISSSILRLVRSYTEVSLANLLLNHQLKSIDVMTQLENKAFFHNTLEHYKNTPDTFLARLSIDNFEYINRHYGEQVGDTAIISTADTIRDHFPKPKGISLARLSGNEFGILFHANNHEDAKYQLDQCRVALSDKTIGKPLDSLPLGASIGYTKIVESHACSLDHAEHAKKQARLLGRNRVEVYVSTQEIAS